MELVDGKAVFQTLKFASTSYNNEGVKFHLLMCVYLQISEDTKPKILKAVISPPIFVDSRKSVRENDKMSENKLALYVEPFYPDNFTRKFVKKETKKKESIEEEIQNSIDGLHSYLTAPNIRNKVKHPIFLCVRFSNCISLHFNPDLIREEDKENLVEFFQGILFEEIEKGQEPTDIRYQDSFFILYINKNDLEDKIKKKKILELLCPIKYRSLSVVFNKTEIPPNFTPIQDLRGLMEQYSKSYSKLLIKSKYCLRGDEENDEEDGPSDKIPPPERQTISFAVDAAPRTQNDWNKYFDTSSYEDDGQKRLKNEDTSSTAPMTMMEARTISYRDSMSRLFPNGQDPLNASLNTPNPQMANFAAGMNKNMMNPMFNKTTPEVQQPNNLAQMGRGMMGNNPLHGMNPALANPALANQSMGRFPNQARPGQNMAGMDPVAMMKLYGMNQQFNPMNMMNAMGQPRGMQVPPGMQLPQGMNMQAMMQAFQQYQQGGDMGIKAESMEGGIENGINVKVQVDEDDDDANRMRRGAKRGDINVKDEESVN